MLIDAGAAMLRWLPPEAAHRATLALLSLAQPLLAQPAADDPRLSIFALGRLFPNPLGLAAGFDKDAEVPAAMLKLGFGFVECGTLTPRPQTGNPRPRLFRLKEDRAVVNRMGFNNRGAAQAADRLTHRQRNGIVGINIGANKDSVDRAADYEAAFSLLAPFADYVTINVSSPNTPGLRGLQTRDELTHLLARLTAARTRAGLTTRLVLKIAPDLDLSALDDIADVALASGIEGLIVTNTTVARPSTLLSRERVEAGGLSGVPLFEPSTAILREMRKRVGANLVLIGAGGVASGRDAYTKIRAGASLVQLYTALAFDGPGLLGRIKRDLCACLVADGFKSVSAAVGIDAR
jgi:dihydroorotate dehydrogenase